MSMHIPVISSGQNLAISLSTWAMDGVHEAPSRQAGEE